MYKVTVLSSAKDTIYQLAAKFVKVLHCWLWGIFFVLFFLSDAFLCYESQLGVYFRYLTFFGQRFLTVDSTIIALGIDVHFLHVKPVQRAGQKVLPLMMVHGWPGSFFEFYRILPMLTETKGDVVFEVICPSIPGYGYSEAPHVQGKTRKLLPK